jgi:mycofactocin glycosyltransferase
MTKNKPLPARVQDLWLTAKRLGTSSEQCAAEQKRELDECAAIWSRALMLPAMDGLVSSTLQEIGQWRGIDDLAIVRRRCEESLRSLKLRWEKTVQQVDTLRVQEYYDTADDCIEELMWWHTLTDDNSPLAYVAALEFASLNGCKTYLDFGSGVGSGALLFASNGFDVSLADISSVMLSFCRFRFELRKRRAMFIDLKESPLPDSAFDFITAMDVFEHLVDPVGTVDTLDRCLKPGGYVYGRFASDEDRERPQHIVQDFRPVFARFAELGFKEVFRDEWLWGHQVYQKAI